MYGINLILLVQEPEKELYCSSVYSLNIHMYIYKYVSLMILYAYDDDDVYLNKLQTKGVKKSILYM